MNLDWIPESDQSRSPFARWVFDQAKKRSLFFSHFESRYSLASPEYWGGSSEEVEKAFDGISVIEDKFSHFHTDSLVASFHPGHHPKWSSHELLHNLLGFFYHQGSSDLEKLLGARISESLPVALFYFFDEAWSNKCILHKSSSSFMSEHCQECLNLQEKAGDAVDQYLIDSGQEFCRREFLSIKDSLSKGISHELVFHGINLASDAHLYLQKNRQRLKDPAIHKIFENFYDETPMYHNISSFLEHAERLLESILKFEDLAQVSLNSTTYLKQDLAMRLLQLIRLCGEGELAEKLMQGFSILEKQSEECMIETFVAFYEKIYEDYEIVKPEKFFALGYDFHPIYGHDLQAVESNLLLCFPEAMRKLGRDESSKLIHTFTRSKEFWQRVSLAKRFSEFLFNQKHESAIYFKKESFFCREKASFQDIQFSENEVASEMRFHPFLECIELNSSELEFLNIETGGLSGDIVYLKIPGRTSSHYYPLAISEFLSIKNYLKTGQLEDLDPSVLDELIRSNFIIGDTGAGNHSKN